LPGRVVMHIDFDYFFAQCEELRRPEIRDRPVVVCVFSGRTEDSGVVSTANYVARKYGVKSGIPIRAAKSKLAGVKEALLLPLDIDYYRQVSDRAMAIIRVHADVFEHVGIDECYVDVSETTGGNFGAAERIARRIKDETRSQMRLTCSVGVAPNKMLAKVASDFKKPDGLTVVKPDDSFAFVSALQVDRIPGIGPKTRDRLAELGVLTAGQLAEFDLFRLIEEFGKKNATYMHNAARGIDDEQVVESEGERKQLMHIVTLKKDATQSADMYVDLEKICRSVHGLVEGKKLAFRTVGVILILKDLENVTRSRMLKTHTSSFDVLYSTAKSMLDEIAIVKSVRRLGVRVADFQDSAGQGTLFDFMQA
jgi:DNA polymerase IV (DinB-like DNA polymerase)